MLKVLWFPYLRFKLPTTGVIHLGKVQIRNDSQGIWSQVLGMERPAWMSCFRDFNRIGSNEYGDPVYGSFVTADDEEWLRVHYKKLVSIIYFLGDEAVYLDELRPGAPSEMFYSILFNFDVDHSGLMRFPSRASNIFESSDSIRLSKPVALRGLNTEYDLKLDESRNQRLIDLLFGSPEDRVITACSRYFEAQKGDLLDFSSELELVRFCISVEAAFGLSDQKNGGLSDQFSNALDLMYCSKDAHSETCGCVLIEQRRRFFRGWYAARSIYVHGLSDFEGESDPRLQAYREFREKAGLYSVARAVARDVILRQLVPLKNKSMDSITYTDNSNRFIYIALEPLETYQAIRRQSRVTGSIGLISSLRDQKLDAFRKSVITFTQGNFNWAFHRHSIHITDLIAVLRVYLTVESRISNNERPAFVQRLVELVVENNSQDLNAIRVACSGKQPSPCYLGNDSTLQQCVTKTIWMLAQGIAFV